MVLMLAAARRAQHQRHMPVEIERKFLVVSDDWREHAASGRRFCQGHIANDGAVSVRVRRAADRAFVTIKGERNGIARAEFEYEIPVEDAEEMLRDLCVKPLLEKTRYCVKHAGLTWEVDVFSGKADGLVLAEVELSSIAQSFDQPAWVGVEVTGDPRYRSSRIAKSGAPRGPVGSGGGGVYLDFIGQSKSYRTI